MKTQVAWSFSHSRTELQVTPQRGESQDIKSAEWLQSLNCELLLPLDYDSEKAHTKKLMLAYDITGHTALKRRLSKVWSLEDYYAVLEAAKCRRLEPYSCRHTTATALAISEGIAPQTIKKVMRWSTTKMLDRYTHPDDQEAIEAVNRLSR